MSKEFEQIALVESMLLRANALVSELEKTYHRDLEAKDVSAEARNLTHEILEKCSNILDQAMAIFFEKEIRPLLSELPKRGGYFPVAKDEAAYRSSLGQWKAVDLGVLAPNLDAKLRSLQPFTDSRNSILLRMRELANRKHTSLAPQKRLEDRRVSVAAPGGGSVSWGSGVTFGSGVSVMGVPINPRTQMPAHTQGIDIRVERWVSFHFEDGGENALSFCKESISATRRVVDTLLS